jgi:WD40 repeat protein
MGEGVPEAEVELMVAESYVAAIEANLEGATQDVAHAEAAGERLSTSASPEPVPLDRRQLATQGVNYDVALDAERGRLYVSSYYSSTVQIVDADTLTPLGSIPTGLGTRALQLVPERDLLLISSVYDGVVRVWDLATESTVAALNVGGHVKDFAVSPGGDTAYFWSQCGLLSLDLRAVREGAR